MEKRCTSPRTYVTWKAYFHSQIHTELRLSNLSADCLYVKLWGLPSLSIRIGDKVKKSVERNWPPFLVKILASSLDSQDND